ncbi:MAG TPA: hypothetical protein VLF94_01465 [Chlamydiales bacterium]|nr:hypothetical protein [Chlamydiales bacterium]
MAHAVNHLRPPPGMRLAPLVRGLGGSVRTITFLALTILTALVSSAFLPWEAAFLLTGGLAALYAMTCCNRNDREDERDPVQRALDQRVRQQAPPQPHYYVPPAVYQPQPPPPPVIVVHQQPVPVYAPPRAPAPEPARVPVGHEADRVPVGRGHAPQEREIYFAAWEEPAHPPTPRAAHVPVGRSGVPLRGTAAVDLAPPPAPPAPANAPRVPVGHEADRIPVERGHAPQGRETYFADAREEYPYPAAPRAAHVPVGREDRRITRPPSEMARPLPVTDFMRPYLQAHGTVPTAPSYAPPLQGMMAPVNLAPPPAPVAQPPAPGAGRVPVGRG